MNKNSEGVVGEARPSHEQITIRAELLWKAQGSPTGRDEEIWLEAERQLFDEARELISPPSSSSGETAENRRGSEVSQSAEQMNSKRPATSSSRRRAASGR